MRGAKFVISIVAAVATVSLGAAAFAIDGDPGASPVADPTTTTAVTTTTTTTTLVPATTTTPAGDAQQNLVIAPTSQSGTGTQRSTEGCDGGSYSNHGSYVSSVAHDPDRQPGDVSGAAQSDCGKPLAATGAAEETTTETESAETSETDTGASTSTSPHGSGIGNGHPNANAQSRTNH
jgi:hypothetical protein